MVERAPSITPLPDDYFHPNIVESITLIPDDYDPQTGNYTPATYDPRLTPNQIGSLLRLHQLSSLSAGQAAGNECGLLSFDGEKYLKGANPITARIGVSLDAQGPIFSFWEEPMQLTVGHGEHSFDAKKGNHTKGSVIREAEGEELWGILTSNQPDAVFVNHQYGRYLVLPNGAMPKASSETSDRMVVGTIFEEIKVPGSNYLQNQIRRNLVFGSIKTTLDYDRAQRTISGDVPSLVKLSLGGNHFIDVLLQRELSVEEITDGDELFSEDYQLEGRQLENLDVINGVPIQELERRMRPGGYSSAGFLGTEDDLTQILHEDDTFVRNSGLTHPQLAEPLGLISRLVEQGLIPDHSDRPITINGSTYFVSPTHWGGYQESPFEDKQKTDKDIELTRLSDGSKLKYSGLIPEMIARYGFYEGQTSYRVSPQSIVEFFGLK